MHHLNEALAHHHQVEARQRAAEDRRARDAQRAGERPSVLRRIIGA
ncbi:MAG: hypothetical protein M3Z03_09335 [Actinomycetota bacterium]|nr:hypothetical protein [Actinomycetota bacterium]